MTTNNISNSHFDHLVRVEPTLKMRLLRFLGVWVSLSSDSTMRVQKKAE